MTFRHVRLTESPIFRALSQRLGESGAVPFCQPEPIQKTAAAEVDPTTLSTDEQILALAEALRETDLASYADQIEQRFCIFKAAKAPSIYNVFKETGESFIQDAHPEGSPDMGGGSESDELARIETQIEQHRKIVEMIQKEPTGKVSKAQAGLEMVRQILGCDDGKKKVSRGLIDSLNALAGVAEIPLVGSEVPGLFARIFQSAPKPIELATTPGAASTGAPVAETAGVAAGTAAAAIAAAALVGAVVGAKYFESKFFADELSDAVDNLMSELRDIRQYTDEANMMASDVSRIPGLMERYSAIATQMSDFKDNPSMEGLRSLKVAYDTATQMSQAANNIRVQAARSAEQNPSLDLIVWKRKGAQFRDVELTAGRVVDIISEKIDPAVLEILNAVERKLNESAQPSAGASKVQQELAAALQQLTLLESKLNAKHLPNQAALSAWLHQTREQAEALQREFEGEASTVRSGSAPRFEKAIGQLIQYLTQFQQRYAL